ncbi:Transcription initiation factor TFIID subunit 10 [Dermatophagoides pteronyssinus]|uniref:Transcription initiation factor TFIID subunit 10 n=1 Tax=Dermatophagoides pteronyssinus TaxID=6956 RepID=A0ABQ8J4E1_DERPT|nr:Transcription initiation factor TFIID subunit 10 [Dermatophagoides pteronyssinus]
MSSSMDSFAGLGGGGECSNENSEPMEIQDSAAGSIANETTTTDDKDNIDPSDDQTSTDILNDPIFSTAGQQLIDFLQYLEDYQPTIPDSVTSHIMHQSGFNTNDTRILRLASLASQKFIADIANDALQHCKMRTTALSQNKKQSKDKRYTLTFEDLVPVLNEYGINIKKPQYFF